MSSEDGLRSRFLEAVDEDAAGLEAEANALGARDVFAPDAGAQAGVGVVGAVDDFFLVGPGLAGDDWAYRGMIVSFGVCIMGECDEKTYRMAPPG